MAIFYPLIYGLHLGGGMFVYHSWCVNNVLLSRDDSDKVLVVWVFAHEAETTRKGAVTNVQLRALNIYDRPAIVFRLCSVAIVYTIICRIPISPVTV